MRYSVRGILDAPGPGKLSRISGLPVPRVTQLVQFLREHTDTLPGGNPGAGGPGPGSGQLRH